MSPLERIHLELVSLDPLSPVPIEERMRRCFDDPEELLQFSNCRPKNNRTPNRGQSGIPVIGGV